MTPPCVYCGLPGTVPPRCCWSAKAVYREQVEARVAEGTPAPWTGGRWQEISDQWDAIRRSWEEIRLARAKVEEANRHNMLVAAANALFLFGLLLFFTFWK